MRPARPTPPRVPAPAPVPAPALGPAAALVAVWAIALAITGHAAAASWVHPPALPDPRLEHRRFASPALRQDAGFQVYLPPGYPGEPERKYPVLYWLHDRGGSEASPALKPALVDAAIRQGILPPLLVIYPNAGPESFYVDSPDGTVPAETLLVRELIPQVDHAFRTIADRTGRFIQGLGMGGFGAFRLAFRHPELFGSAVAYAGEFQSAEAISRLPEFAGIFSNAFGGDFLRLVTQHPVSQARVQAEKLRGRTGLLLVTSAREPRHAATREFREALWPARLAVELVESAAAPATGTELVDAEGLAGLEFAATWLGTARSTDRDGPWVNPPTNRIPRLRHHVFHSRLLDRPVGYNLYLPPGYEVRDASAPVLPLIVHLPAWGEDESRHLQTAGYLDAAIRLGGLPPSAWVWAYGGRTSWYTDTADGRVPAGQVLLGELLPHVEARWRLGGAPGRRSLDGWGMGAYGALRFVAARPDLVGTALLHNPVLPDADGFASRYPDAWIRVFGSDPERFASTEPLSILSRNADRLRGALRLRVVVGENAGRLSEARRLRDHLASLGLGHDYEEIAGEGALRPGLFHATGLRDMQFLSPIPTPPRDTPP